MMRVIKRFIDIKDGGAIDPAHKYYTIKDKGKVIKEHGPGTYLVDIIGYTIYWARPVGVKTTIAGEGTVTDIGTVTINGVTWPRIQVTNIEGWSKWFIIDGSSYNKGDWVIVLRTEFGFQVIKCTLKAGLIDA